MRALATSSLVAVALAVAGCGNGGGGGGHATNNGIVWLSWTINGAAVSDTSCKSIDHIGLAMQTSLGPLTIEPIPCLRGLGWEYDNLPTGNDLVILDGIDARGNVVVRGSSPVTVTPTRPPTPAPIDLTSSF